jgi:tRNA-dihydrouridine synthase B
MLRDTDNALAVGKAMIAEAGKGRVGFKLRLGWQVGEEVFLRLAGKLEEAGAGWITLHPRFARQGFSGPVDRSALTRLKAEISVPVVAGGDLFTVEDALRCLRESGADTVMFARGAMADPTVFRRYRETFEGRVIGPPSSSGLHALIRRHAALIRKYSPKRRNNQNIEAGLVKMRSFVPQYAKHMPGARALRAALLAMRDWEELDGVLEHFFPTPERERDGL